LTQSCLLSCNHLQFLFYYNFLPYFRIYLLDSRRDRFRGIDRGLGGVNGGHDIGSGGGVQAEGTGNPGHLACRKHKSQPQQQVFPEGQQTCHQDRRLEECRQAQADDLLHPLRKTVNISTGDAEHVKAPYRDLDEQDAAPFQVGKKYFYYSIAHGDHAEDQHDRAGQHGHHEGWRSRHIAQAGYGSEVLYDLSAHLRNAGSQTGDLSGKFSLQVH
jgi:hypothetical protein